MYYKLEKVFETFVYFLEKYLCSMLYFLIAMYIYRNNITFEVIKNKIYNWIFCLPYPVLNDSNTMFINEDEDV